MRNDANALGPVALQNVRITDIDLEDTTYQYRLGPPAFGLRESLEGNGQLNPVSLMSAEGGFRILDGFCRTRVAKDLGWTTVAANVYPSLSDEKAKMVAWVKNVVRKNLTRVDRANAMQIGRKAGLSAGEVAKAFGVSERTVRRYLNLPAEVLAVTDGRDVTIAHAQVLARKFGEGTGVVCQDLAMTAKQVIRDHLTAKELAQQIDKTVSARSRRLRKYAQIDIGQVRVYPFKLTAATHSSELYRAADRLDEAAEALRRIARGRKDEECDSARPY